MRLVPSRRRRSAKESVRPLPRATAALAIAIAVVGTLVPSFAGAQTPPSDDDLELRVGVVSDLITDNPWAVSAGSDWSVVTVQYDMMLKFAAEDLSPAPSLATGCEPNEDSTEWTCTLREGLRWSDGSPLTSRDIAFTYRFVIDNKIPQYKSYFSFDPTFETPDDNTLIWKAEEPTFAPDMPPPQITTLKLGAASAAGTGSREPAAPAVSN